MSDEIAFINFPLQKIIKCEHCHEPKIAIFSAESRKNNFLKHLQKKHGIRSENTKIKCSVCGWISNKSRRMAWRDTQAHHRSEHSNKTAVMTEAGQPLPVGLPTVDDAPSFSRETNEKVSAQSLNSFGIIDLSKSRGTVRTTVTTVTRTGRLVLPPAPITWYKDPFLSDLVNCVADTPTVERLAVKKQKNSWQLTSKIIAAVDKMFNVVKNCQPNVIVHSTPEKKSTNDGKTAPTTQPKILASNSSRIKPRARPALRRSGKRHVSSPTPISFAKNVIHVGKFNI
ncbi:uncharacterized protein LOC131672899 isoform X2 [Phymastichus coffea]|uniref:uncharacterized protein LOC131672899 isoform X2 n=1 Tax=Phymastichus coffea TaxID=108790 RepID=UPI00273B7729|nr:uncharacterized protein LOC131672899 isoform X2 [Phymastichus coffea]